MADYKIAGRRLRRKPVVRARTRCRPPRAQSLLILVSLLIFDLDGTLIDSRLDLAHAVNATRAQLDKGPLPHEQIFSFVGNGAPVLIQRAMGPDALEDEVRDALEFFLDYYGHHALDHTLLYPRCPRIARTDASPRA